MHIATFLFGMTAILGKLITINEFNLVWYRMLIASLAFLLIPSFWKHIKKISKKELNIFFINGIVVALHWLTFYGSIKINNNASLTLACFGTVSLFAAILEPIILKTKFKKSEITLGFAVLFGLGFIAYANPDKDYSLNSNYIIAINLALISSLLAVIFTIINKKYIKENNPLIVTWAQMTGGFLFLSLLLPFVIHSGMEFQFFPNVKDTILLIIMAILCTNIAFSLEVESLKNMSAFTSNLILNLEPIYGIVAAIIIFKENKILNFWFYLGASIIVVSVFAHGFYSKKKSKAILQ